MSMRTAAHPFFSLRAFALAPCLCLSLSMLLIVAATPCAQASGSANSFLSDEAAFYGQTTSPDMRATGAETETGTGAGAASSPSSTVSAPSYTSPAPPSTGRGTGDSLSAPRAADPAPVSPLGGQDQLVFGAQLFTGAFAQQGATQFNPDYAIAIGDKIHVRLWGAFALDEVLVVDPKGNLFIPHVGPVQLQGVKNSDLQSTIHTAIRRVFRANVSSYASLASAQPVRVFVSGNVKRPGLYNGTSMDSLLHYIDQAGGIDTQRGSFLDVQVKRGESTRARVNLYTFLLSGQIPQIQLADGDVIFVPPMKNTVFVSGLAENQKRFEFNDDRPFSVAELLTLAHPLPSATHLRITRNLGANSQVGYFPIGESSTVQIMNGDRVEFTADRRPATISIRVEGEHQSPQEFVLDTGATLGEVMAKINLTDRAQVGAIQLFRRSVKDRQKEMLDTALRSLEMATLTARSGTDEEAMLRREEANMVLKWVERARNIEPSGQVVLSKAQERDALVLEDGDIVRIPAKDSLVLVSGEVLFPNAMAYSDKLRLQDYINNAGGYSQNASVGRIVVAHMDGSFERIDDSGSSWTGTARSTKIQPGDQIMVLPKIDVKSRQIAKDLTQILYQIAVSAKVVLGL